MERQTTTEAHTVVANLIWKYNELVLSAPIELGSLPHLGESSEFEVKISHDSALEISESGFYLKPFSNLYEGTFSPLKDFERVLWLANNYPGYGLSIRQEYEVTGQLDVHDGIRLIDFERNERTDVLTGETIEILSGDALGETAIIDSYNPTNQIFILNGNFSTDVTNENYKISIDKEEFFKTGQGSDYTNTIPLIYKGGVIERLDEVTVKLKLRIPKFAQSAGKFLFDLNMEFTSLEEI